MKHTQLVLDAKARAIRKNGTDTCLQYKPWKVLLLLIERSPEAITRDEIIDEVWAGNFLVGDKALNQALWTIRHALKDSPKSPDFIETIPKSGYRWIARQHKILTDRNGRNAVRFIGQAVASLLFLSFAITSVLPNIEIDIVRQAPEAFASGNFRISDPNGGSAFLDGEDLIVDSADGLRAILHPTENKKIRKPIFSKDGRTIAFEAWKNGVCSTYIFNFDQRQVSSFGRCVV